MKHLCLLLLIVFAKTCCSQNLIPNGSFEQYTSCPTQASEIDSVLYWMTPSWGTPDYFNLCGNTAYSTPENFAGNQQPYDGVAYAGIFLFYFYGNNYREYIEDSLSSPLIPGECYHISFHCSLADQMNYTTDNIGIYLSDTAIENVQTQHQLSFLPQIVNPPGNFFDTLNWTLVEGDYLATGGENYLIIGNFNDDASTDTINIGGSGLVQRAYVYIDSVSLVPTTCVTGIKEVKKETAKIFPNPVVNEFTIQLGSNEPAEIILCDVTSRKLLEQNVIGSSTINMKDFSKGIYFYEVKNKNGFVQAGKLLKE